MKLFQSLLAVFLMATLLWASPASAVVTTVTPSPDVRNVTYSTGSSTLTVTWIITRTTVGAPVDLRSPPGIFTVGNVNFFTPARRKLISGNPKTVTFTETVSVPQKVMKLALDTQNGNFSYSRDFADDPPANTFVSGSMDVVVVGGMGGQLGLSDVTLQFDNGATYATAHQGDPLRAQARIRSNGTGQLAAVWEVSDGDSSSFFRPIRTVNISLAGQRMITETSPPLPTSSDGRRNVRFRVTNPPGSDIKPVVTYFITPGAGAAAKALGSYAPPPDEQVLSGTPFKWEAAKGASAYRLQIIDANGNVLASQLVRGTEAPLSAFVFAQLQGPATYRWRVTALSVEGEVVGSTDPKPIKVKGR